jgi:hypothetical protein
MTKPTVRCVRADRSPRSLLQLHSRLPQSATRFDANPVRPRIQVDPVLVARDKLRIDHDRWLHVQAAGVDTHAHLNDASPHVRQLGAGLLAGIGEGLGLVGLRRGRHDGFEGAGGIDHFAQERLAPCDAKQDRGREELVVRLPPQRDRLVATSDRECTIAEVG